VPFLWSEQAQRYRDQASGRFVSSGSVNGAVDQVVDAAGLRMRDLSAQLQVGDISLADWQSRMATEMKLLHTGAAAVGRGGWAQMTPSDWGWTGYQLRQQYAYLRNFAHDIATGRQPMDGRLLSRSALYAEAARSTQRNMQRRTGQRAGRLEERNVLGVAEQHCEDCPYLSDLGWVPIGTLPLIGARQCRVRCACTIETRGDMFGLVA